MKCILLLLALTLSACAGPGLDGGAKRAPNQERALVTVYLNAFGSSSGTVSFAMEDLALGDEAAPQHLDVDAFNVDSSKAVERQLLVGAAVVPAGNYSSMRFRLADVKVDGTPQAGDAPVLTLSFPSAVSLGAGDSVCLFVRWNLDNAISESRDFAPQFSARGQEVPLASELVYVNCDDIDTIYIVRTDQNRVVGSLGLVGRLGQMRVDANRQRLYVVSEGARSIFVLDCATNRFVDRIALPMTLAPRFMAISEDGLWAFVTDAEANQIVRVDLGSGVAAGQTTAVDKPERIIWFEDNGSGQLAVSSSESRQVSLLNADTLGVRQTLSAGMEPSGLLYDQGNLYVCDRAGAAVTVHDLNSGRQRARITVGQGPEYLLADSVGRIYVANQGDGNLSVIIEGQHTALRQIPIGSDPGAMAYSDRRNLLYVAGRTDKNLAVLDAGAAGILTNIALGGTPNSVAYKF